MNRTWLFLVPAGLVCVATLLKLVPLLLVAEQNASTGLDFSHHQTRFCLNMIMKNEAHVLQTTFDSLSEELAGWFVCDTGSTDGSARLTNSYFRRRKIPGNVVHHPWVNFAHNRNLCLADGRREMSDLCDYWIIFDADQQLVRETTHHLWEYRFLRDAYFLKERSHGVYFSNPRIVKLGSRLEYRGAVHEYIHPVPDRTGKEVWPVIGQVPDGFWSLHDHVRKRSLEDDVAILLDELSTDPNSTRLHFYLAKAYREIPGQLRKSLEHFAQRIALEPRVERRQSQEMYYSLYAVANIFEVLFVGDKLDEGHSQILMSHGLIDKPVAGVKGIADLYGQASEYASGRYEPYGNIAKLYWYQDQNAAECYRYAEMGLQKGSFGDAASNMFTTEESLHCLHFMKCRCGFHARKYDDLLSACRYNIERVPAGDEREASWVREYRTGSLQYARELEKMGVTN